jgi:hypothetical protein
MIDIYEYRTVRMKIAEGKHPSGWMLVTQEILQILRYFRVHEMEMPWSRDYHVMISECLP